MRILRFESCLERHARNTVIELTVVLGAVCRKTRIREVVPEPLVNLHLLVMAMIMYGDLKGMSAMSADVAAGSCRMGGFPVLQQLAPSANR